MKKLFKYLFFTILALFSLGQLQRIQLNEVIAFYAHDLFIAIWLGLVAHKYRKKILAPIKRYFFNPLTSALVIWIALGLVINFIGYGFSLIPLLYLARVVFYLLFALSLSLVTTNATKPCRYCWILVGLVMAVLGLVQYFFLPDTRFLRYLGWDDHYFRLIGTQLDPNFTGILLTASFLIAQGVWSKQNRIKTSISALLAGTILLTYSRASFVSLILGSALIIFLELIKSHKKNINLSIIMGLFIILIPFLPRPDGEGVKLERTASISARIESNQLSLNSLNKQEWLFGRGLFTYQSSVQPPALWPNTAHFPNNLVVFLLASTGIVGLGLSLIILYKIGRYLYEKDIYIFTAFIAILIHSQFNHTLFQPFVWLWLVSQVLTIEKN